MIEPAVEFEQYPLRRTRFARVRDLSEQTGRLADQIIEVERGTACLGCLIRIHDRARQRYQRRGRFECDQLLPSLDQRWKRIPRAAQRISQDGFRLADCLGDETAIGARIAVQRHEGALQRKTAGVRILSLRGLCEILGALLIGSFSRAERVDRTQQRRLIEYVRHCAFGGRQIEIERQIESTPIQAFDGLLVVIGLQALHGGQPAAMTQRILQNVVEAVVGGKRNRDAQRARQRGIRIACGFDQCIVDRCAQDRRSRRLVENGEVRRNPGFERKALQQPLAKPMDGLHFQATRRFDGECKQLSRTHHFVGHRRSAQHLGQQHR